MIIWVVKIFFCIPLLCILASSSYYLLLLLVPYFSVFYWARRSMQCYLGISNFLEEISSLSHSVVFLYFFALITEEGDGIPVELFQILKDDAVKVLHSICQQVWKTQ